HPRHDVARAQLTAEPARDRLQQLVAGVVTHRVVDALESVEIDEQQGDLSADLRGMVELALEMLDDEPPVRKPGQAVEIGEAPDVLFALSLRRDVADHRDDLVLS